MATFVENLWNSVFTPGTTPTLLIATNATFAALQLILGLLLISTYSIHFVILSILSAGLWWAINWFAAELAKAEKAEEEAKQLRKRRTNSGMADSKKDDFKREAEYGGDSTETETEVEGKRVGGVQIRGGPGKAQAVMASATDDSDNTFDTSKVRIRGGPAKIQGVMDSAAEAEAARQQSASTGFQPRGGPAKIQAVLDSANTGASESQGSFKTYELGESGSVSTDSEWEKVSDR